MSINNKKILTAITLFLLLVALPLGSWYYLQRGLNYYKKAVSELKDYGKVPQFSFTDQDGKTLGSEDMQGKVYVANFIFTRCTTICPKMTEQMSRLYEVFHKNQEIGLLSFTVDPAHDSVAVLKTYAEANHIPDDGVWHLLTGDKQQIYELVRKGFRLPVGEGANGGDDDFIHSNYFALVDATGTVRNYYDGTDPAQVDRLMQHIALIIPKEKKEVATKKVPQEL
jgi:protein SCO1/2